MVTDLSTFGVQSQMPVPVDWNRKDIQQRDGEDPSSSCTRGKLSVFRRVGNVDADHDPGADYREKEGNQPGSSYWTKMNRNLFVWLDYERMPYSYGDKYEE